MLIPPYATKNSLHIDFCKIDISFLRDEVLEIDYSNDNTELGKDLYSKQVTTGIT